MTPRTPRDRYVFFDIDGVLIDGFHARPERRRSWSANLLEDLGIDPHRFEPGFFAPDAVFRTEVLLGKKPLIEALAEHLRSLDIAMDPQRLIDYWLAKDRAFNLELLRAVAQIKSCGGVRLFIATNQEHTRARYLMEQPELDGLFEDIFHSARIGALKPDRAYFDWIERHLGLDKADRPILFDDTPAVVEAARIGGWEAVEYRGVQDLQRSPLIASLLGGAKDRGALSSS